MSTKLQRSSWGVISLLGHPSKEIRCLSIVSGSSSISRIRWSKIMMEIIEKCMRSSDLSGLHALQSMWDCSDSSTFSPDRLLKSKKTLLMTASRLGHLECCKFLLSISMPKIDSRSKLEAKLSA